jgi:hypothetical protein
MIGVRLPIGPGVLKSSISWDIKTGDMDEKAP